MVVNVSEADRFRGRSSSRKFASAGRRPKPDEFGRRRSQVNVKTTNEDLLRHTLAADPAALI